ncbi:hypothetical protein [Micromonospora haikouensis]|uniref:hypothetical protein n=1 Tax=Micromonospora haikouensis TaxID=686309 RepID=UPI00379C4016
MIFFDILVYLAVAKIAVLLLEDAAYAVRGKQSPRRQARARLQAAGQKADGSAGASAPAGAGRTGSTVAAADGYLAGLIEDATERARARRRRAVARKRGAQAVDGVVVDVDDDGRWYADCDLCGWSSRPYRIEDNAQGAGRDHTRTEHPDQYTGQPEPASDSAESSATDDGEQEPRRPALRVIPGGAQDTQQPVPQQPASRTEADDRSREPASSVVHTDDHSYCQTPGCPRCRPPRFEWRCNRCGERSGGSFTSIEDAQDSAARHTCPTAETSTDTATPAGPPNQDDHKTTGGDAGDNQHHPTVNPAAGSTSTTEQLREMTVNLEATGPEEIRAAFNQAAETAGENAETIGGIAGVLTEAADRYEGLDMAASTVGHLRDAAEQFAAAQAALNTAQEELQAALADFTAKDGAVAETVAETGGNVASKEVLVG